MLVLNFKPPWLHYSRKYKNQSPTHTYPIISVIYFPLTPLIYRLYTHIYILRKYTFLLFSSILQFPLFFSVHPAKTVCERTSNRREATSLPRCLQVLSRQFEQSSAMHYGIEEATRLHAACKCFPLALAPSTAFSASYPSPFRSLL